MFAFIFLDSNHCFSARSISEAKTFLLCSWDQINNSIYSEVHIKTQELYNWRIIKEIRCISKRSHYIFGYRVRLQEQNFVHLRFQSITFNFWLERFATAWPVLDNICQTFEASHALKRRAPNSFPLGKFLYNSIIRKQTSRQYGERYIIWNLKFEFVNAYD